MHPDTPKSTDLTMPTSRANIVALLLFIPLTLLLLPFVLVWGWEPLVTGTFWLIDNLLLLAGLFVAGVIVHELVHALAWVVFGRCSLRAITFGFQLKTLTPYAHCTVPLPARAYRIGAAAPGLVLGVLPLIIATFTGAGALAFFAWLMLIAAGGDALILWLLRAVPADRLVQDHPTAVGCMVLE
jgi:Putative zincin peptidase